LIDINCLSQLLTISSIGHAGPFSAEFTASHLKAKIEETSEWKRYFSLSSDERKKQSEIIGKALVQAFVGLDEDLRGLKECGIMDQSGCTLVCTIITPSHVVCANVGDSRAVLGRKKEVIALTEDHKPSLTEEKLRIENAGSFVRFDRVNGELAMSRAIGDFRYKESIELEIHEHPVICLPDISVQERNPEEDEVLLLACDGVWDVISNEEAVQFVSNIVLQNNNEKNSKDNSGISHSSSSSSEESSRDSASSSSSSSRMNFSFNKRSLSGEGKVVSALEAAESLIDLALKDGSTDNISAIVVKFLPSK
jgi:serine/threonine protein phosphatase PrpC